MTKFIKKHTSLTVCFLTALILGGCGEYTEEQRESFYAYKNNALDVLVPITCVDSVQHMLEEMKVNDALNFEYRKFLALQDAYSHIDGYVSLISDEKHSMGDLHNLRIKLTSQCFAGAEFFYERNDKGWIDFRKEIEYFEKYDIKFHTTVIGKDKLSIYFNKDEYDNKKGVY